MEDGCWMLEDGRWVKGDGCWTVFLTQRAQRFFMLIMLMGAKALRSAKGKRGFWVAEWDCRVVRASLLAMTFSFFFDFSKAHGN